MGKCAYCSDDVLLPFTCNFCGGQFCTQHRLPENHVCPNQHSRTPLGRWKAKNIPLDNRIVKRELDSDDARTLSNTCPSCFSSNIIVLGYEKRKSGFDRNNIHVKCDNCNYAWWFKKDQTITFHVPPETIRKEHKSHKKLIATLGIVSIIIVSLYLMQSINIHSPTDIQHPKTPPTVSNIGRSTSEAGASAVFSAKMQDAHGLSKHIFSFDNGQGTFANTSATAFSGNPAWANVTITLTSTVGATIRYRWFFNNTNNVWNRTAVQSFTTTIRRETLVTYALSIINSDRTTNGLSNVSLSILDSAQKHADNMLQYYFLSHWDTSGYKPYMRYTLSGGKGSVAENVAWQYSSATVDGKEAIKNLEWQMMYNDASSGWGHRDNILNPSHNKVSIGIAYDKNNVYFVQDFIDEYVPWSTFSVTQNQVTLIGSLTNQMSLSQVNIFYDSLPSNLTKDQLQNSPYNGAYTQGIFVGMALPPGYTSVDGITITAQTWTQTGTSFQIQFNIASAFNTRGKGVYTIYLQTTSQLLLTTYSLWNS